MTRLRAWWSRLGDLVLRSRREREMDAELDAHLTLAVDDNVKAGMTPVEARRAALIALGGLETTREAYRDRRGLPRLDALLRDVRFGARLLVRSPGFAGVAILALALSTGATMTIFSVANAFLIRPLPVADPGHVVRAYSYVRSNTPYPEYIEYRDRNRTLSGLGAFQRVSLSLRIESEPERVAGMVVSGNYFETLGVAAARGRVLTVADDHVGAPAVMVLGHRFWRRRFNADPSVIGRVVPINGQPYVVIGVVKPEFTGTMAPYSPDVWVPWDGPGVLPADAARAPTVHMIGRLRVGATLAHAQADLSAIAAALGARAPAERRDLKITVRPARTLVDEFRGGAMAFVTLLSAVSGLVLLIACVNIANLLLARAADRWREMGIRLAIGAGRARLVRQLLTESALVAIIGATCGCALAALTLRLVSSMDLSAPIPLAVELPFDWRVAVFAVVMVGATTLAFGLVPAWQASKTSVVSALKDGTRGAGHVRARLRATLVIMQVALSTVLLVTAAVLGRGMATAERIDRGFDGRHVLTATVDFSVRGYSPGRASTFLSELVPRLRSAPGIDAAAATDIVPLTLSNNQTTLVSDVPGGDDPHTARPYFSHATPGYFTTIGIPLLAGRDFRDGDGPDAPPVCIVNETLATLLFPGVSPVGRQVRVPEGPNRFGRWMQVIGVAKDSKYVSIGEAQAAYFYRPLSQVSHTEVTLLLRTGGDPRAALASLRSAVQDLDPELPLFNVSPLDDVTAITLLPVQIAAYVSGALGAVALALAVMGLYGVLAYVVRQRTPEIGIRVALGARPVDIVRSVVRHGMAWTAVGLACGLGLAWLVTRLLTSLLYGVDATDTLAFAGIGLLLLATTSVACLVPARRASTVDPIVALRHE